ncbi:hypothetical protein BPOR_1131g00020 [Botrytis porri]|uniref:Uncharacterized protein n=1 Tax=Botrytis porri TaxID=87229 RepID=A0A4Z1KJX4_9HELO|nr:hypothetical protein BPOR_1131g00020 [Botrytis porri]
MRGWYEGDNMKEEKSSLLQASSVNNYFELSLSLLNTSKPSSIFLKIGESSKFSTPYPQFKHRFASIISAGLLYMTTRSSKAAEHQVGEYVFTTTGWHVPKPEDISNDVTFIIAHPPYSKNFKPSWRVWNRTGLRPTELR